jgi:hypothetical protein
MSLLQVEIRSPVKCINITKLFRKNCRKFVGGNWEIMIAQVEIGRYKWIVMGSAISPDFP